VPALLDGARLTKQRALVLAALTASGAFHSAQELHAELVANGSRIGLATVYRALQALADSGEVDVLQAEDGTLTYRRCARQDHHHHLTCRQCGHSVEIDGPSVEQWATVIGTKYGFADIEHRVELSGTCAHCSRELES